MNVVLVAVGTAPGPVADALGEVAGVRSVEVAAVPEPAGRDELDPVLDAVAGRRLVVAGSLAAVGDVLTRLRRRDELATTPVGVIRPDGGRGGSGLLPELDGHGPRSSAPGPAGPAGLAAAARIAATGVPRPADLVRDDHGGVLLDRAELAGWHGRRLGMRAYADDSRVADGEVRGLAVVRTGAGMLRAQVRPVRHRWAAGPGRPSGGPATAGRAVQVSCEDARLTLDGRAHPRPITRRTWWVEPAGWLLVSPICA